MTQLAQYDFNIVLLGDFNVNMLKYNDFSNCLDINGLTNIIKEPTIHFQAACLWIFYICL